MDLKSIQTAALERGITVQGLDAVVAKVQARFGDTPPPPQVLGDFLDTLDIWTKLGLGEAQFLSLPAAERMTMARAFVPAVPVHPRRPVSRSLTTEELAQLDAEGLPWAERREKARQMQQTPEP